MSRLIIIPDVHGRSFWRKAVEEYPEEEFIFLGDYLDPYRQEGIGDSKSFRGLQDIVSFKENHPDRVTLLWGNHDLHYLYPELEGARLDRQHAGRNEDFFRWHEKDFCLAAERRVAGERYLFTHAGVGRLWIEECFPSMSEDSVTAAFLNEKMHLPPFIQALSRVSFYRYGPDMYGSCIWADLQEQGESDNRLKSTIQVFGHTMVREPFNADNRIYDLDCQACFYLDLERGGIFCLGTDEPVEPYVNKRNR